MEGDVTFPEKIQVVIYSLEENWYEPRSRSNSTPLPPAPPLSGSDGEIILFIFIFCM